MAMQADEDFDDFDEGDDFDSTEPAVIYADKNRARLIRKELDRRLELKQLRELLDDDDLNDFD